MITRPSKNNLQNMDISQNNIIRRLYFGSSLSVKKISDITGLPQSYIKQHLNKKEISITTVNYGKRIALHDNEWDYYSLKPFIDLSKLKYNDVKKEEKK